MGQARRQERAYLLPATATGRGGGGGAARTTCGLPGSRRTYTLRAGQGRGEPGRRGEREPKLGERSDLGAGGGAASGAAGASASGSALAQEAESAAHLAPARAQRAKAGWAGGCRPSTPAVTPQLPAHSQDDEEAAASHAAAGPHGQLGTVSVHSVPASPTLTPARPEGRWRSGGGWRQLDSHPLTNQSPTAFPSEGHPRLPAKAGGKGAGSWGKGHPPPLIGVGCGEDQGC